MTIFAFPDGDAYFETVPKAKIVRPSFCMPTSDNKRKDRNEYHLVDALAAAMAKTIIQVTPREYQVMSDYKLPPITPKPKTTKITNIGDEAEKHLLQSYNRAMRTLRRQGQVLQADEEIWRGAIGAMNKQTNKCSSSTASLSQRITESRARIREYRKAIEWEEAEERKRIENEKRIASEKAKAEAEKLAKSKETKKESTKKESKTDTVEPIKSKSTKESPNDTQSQQNQSQTEENGSKLKIEDYERPAALAKLAAVMEASQKSRDAAARAKADTTPNLKTARLKVRMDINKRVSQICSDKKQVFFVIRDLLGIFNDAWKDHGSDLLHYCFELTAQKMLEQAETQIAIHTPSAFPAAQVCVDLGGIQPVFMAVLLTRMFDRCTYAIPRYVPRKPGQTDVEYRQSMGYAGEGELEQAYRDRMCGIIALYGAIMQTKPLRKGLQHPHDLSHAWTWIASILNMSPRPITPLLICSFLEVAGYELAAMYSKNFPSLMNYLVDVYIPRLPAECIAAKTRLELYLEDVKRRDFKPACPDGSILE